MASALSSRNPSLGRYLYLVVFALRIGSLRAPLSLRTRPINLLYTGFFIFPYFLILIRACDLSYARFFSFFLFFFLSYFYAFSSPLLLFSVFSIYAARAICRTRGFFFAHAIFLFFYLFIFFIFLFFYFLFFLFFYFFIIIIKLVLH